MSEGTRKAEPVKKPLLSNKVYDVVHYLALIAFPAVGTLYFAVALIWGLPHAKDVVGTIIAVDTFLGALVNVSNSSYNASDVKFDGELEIGHYDQAREMSTFSLNLNGHPNDLTKKNEVVFKVTQEHDGHGSLPGEVPPVPPAQG